MGLPELPLPPPGEQASRFAATDWSLVLAAGGTNADSVRPAMARLLETYWYPLYAFVRRKGRNPDDASDLTQEFLARLVERNYLSLADPAKGKFRTFLLTALERFLVDEHRRATREKRGGGRAVLSLSMLGAEDRYRLEPADTLTAEHLFERRWTITLLEEALKRLEQESVAAGRGPLFAALKPVLAGEQADASYSEIARGLAMKEGALKTAVHRLRRRFAAILRSKIAETVAGPEEVEEEVQHLFQSLA
ncbi:MAG: sigma-70 family RNA polymerase sigma factor [Planctomycetes bacterium]|nr:sigma-70 family RNA polymerase sigma factor [Planctomycetota bacterium]